MLSALPLDLRRRYLGTCGLVYSLLVDFVLEVADYAIQFKDSLQPLFSPTTFMEMTAATVDFGGNHHKFYAPNFFRRHWEIH